MTRSGKEDDESLPYFKTLLSKLIVFQSVFQSICDYKN